MIDEKFFHGDNDSFRIIIFNIHPKLFFTFLNFIRSKSGIPFYLKIKDFASETYEIDQQIFKVVEYYKSYDKPTCVHDLIRQNLKARACRDNADG